MGHITAGKRPRYASPKLPSACRWLDIAGVHCQKVTDYYFQELELGRQWGKIKGAPKGQNTYEIDIVALNDDAGDIAFIECKWKSLSERNALDILNGLKGKSGFVLWNNEMRREYFCLVAKRIEGKDALRKKGFMVFDLDDFYAGQDMPGH